MLRIHGLFVFRWRWHGVHRVGLCGAIYAHFVKKWPISQKCAIFSDSGFTVTDPNHPDSSWSVPSQLAGADGANAGTGTMLTWGVAENEMGTIPGIGGCEQGPPCDCDCDSVFNQ